MKLQQNHFYYKVVIDCDAVCSSALSLSVSQGNSQTNSEGYSALGLGKSTVSPGALPSLVNVYPSGLAIRCCLVAALKVRGWLISVCHRARTPMTLGRLGGGGGGLKTRNTYDTPETLISKVMQGGMHCSLLPHATLCSPYTPTSAAVICSSHIKKKKKKTNTTHSSHTKHKIQSFYPRQNSTTGREREEKKNILHYPERKSTEIAISHILIQQEHKKPYTCTRLAGCVLPPATQATDISFKYRLQTITQQKGLLPLSLSLSHSRGLYQHHHHHHHPLSSPPPQILGSTRGTFNHTEEINVVIWLCQL